METRSPESSPPKASRPDASSPEAGWLTKLGHVLWQEKIYWMVPLGLMAAVLVVLTLVANSTANSPFMYTLY